MGTGWCVWHVKNEWMDEREQGSERGIEIWQGLREEMGAGAQKMGGISFAQGSQGPHLASCVD